MNLLFFQEGSDVGGAGGFYDDRLGGEGRVCGEDGGAGFAGVEGRERRERVVRYVDYGVGGGAEGGEEGAGVLYVCEVVAEGCSVVVWLGRLAEERRGGK